MQNIIDKRYKKALLFVKETYLEQVKQRGDTVQLAEIAARKPGVEAVARSHDQHTATVARVQKALGDRDIECVVVKQSDNLESILADIDLVVTIGGDGTFLRISHEVLRDIPVLGVNSAPITSFGHFCITDAAGFAGVMDDVLAGRLQTVDLLRLELTLDGVPLRELVLNEVLIAHQHPAGTSRYQLSSQSKTGTKTAAHKGSGLLVAAPSGTTGFLRSEGGPVLPIDARSFAWQKRAPFLRLFEKPGLLSGIADDTTTLTVVSHMQGGKLYVDGEHIEYDFARGAVLEIKASPNSLKAFVDRDCHKPYQLEARLGAIPFLGRLLAPAASSLMSRLKYDVLDKSNV